MRKYEQHNSTLGGIDANLLALLCYLAASVISFIPVLSYIAWLAPLVVFFLEKESGLVKFHSMQAFILGLAGGILKGILSIIVGIITAVGTAATVIFGGYGSFVGGVAISALIAVAINIVILVFAIIAMVKAYKNEEYNIPLVGKLTRWVLGKFPPANNQGYDVSNFQ